MEDFSTPQNRAVPWAANTLTVAALALATWWSAAQRPPADLGQQLVVVQSPSPANSKPQASLAGHGVQLASTLGVSGGTSLVRPASLPLQTVSRDAVQPVSYLPLGKH